MFPELNFYKAGDLSLGRNWHCELRRQLADADFGVFCLTKESLDSLWLAYEAGMLGQREPPVPVVLFLFGVNRAEIHGPFQIYQCLTPDETGIRILAESLWKTAIENHVDMPDSFGLNARVELMASSLEADITALWEVEKDKNKGEFSTPQDRTITDISKKLDMILSALPAMTANSGSSAGITQTVLNRPS